MAVERVLVIPMPEAPERYDRSLESEFRRAVEQAITALMAQTVEETSTYLPLAGGTLTGALTGTALTLSGALTVSGVVTLPGAAWIKSSVNARLFYSLIGTTYFGLQTSSGGYIWRDSTDAIDLMTLDEAAGHLKLGHAGSYLQVGTANVSEALLGISANTAGHEGISLHHDGAVGYLICVDEGTAWHDIEYQGNAHKFYDGGALGFTVTSNGPKVAANKSLGFNNAYATNLYYSGGQIWYDDGSTNNGMIACVSVSGSAPSGAYPTGMIHCRTGANAGVYIYDGSTWTKVAEMSGA